MTLEDAEQLALDLMRQHGLRRWTFTFDRAVCRFGCCNERKRTISLSAKLTELNDEDAVRDTILHEIAHAMVGVRAGHGPKWQRQALAIGSRRYVATAMKSAHRPGSSSALAQPVKSRSAAHAAAESPAANAIVGLIPVICLSGRPATTNHVANRDFSPRSTAICHAAPGR